MKMNQLASYLLAILVTAIIFPSIGLSYHLEKSLDCLVSKNKAINLKVGSEIVMHDQNYSKYSVAVYYDEQICLISKKYFLLGISKKDSKDFLAGKEDPSILLKRPPKNKVVSLGFNLQTSGKNGNVNLFKDEKIELVDSSNDQYIFRKYIHDRKTPPTDDELLLVNKKQLIERINSKDRVKLVAHSPMDFQFIMDTKEKINIIGANFKLHKGIRCSKGGSIGPDREVSFIGSASWGYIVQDTKNKKNCHTANKSLLNALSDADYNVIKLYEGGSIEIDRVIRSDIKAQILDLASFTLPEAKVQCQQITHISTNYDYKDCRKGRTYLDADINSALDGMERDPNWSKNPMSQCIFKSMERDAAIRHRSCPTKSSPNMVARKAKRPCVSPALHELMATSFINATKCLGIDPKSFFKIINHESQFFPTAQSPSGVAGPAMTSSDAIIDVDRALDGYFSISNKKKIPPVPKSFMEMQGFSKYMKNPKACKAIKNTLSKPHGDYYFNKGRGVWSVSSCSRIRMPQNPAHAFIYGGIIHLRNKARLEKSFKKYIPKITGSDEEIKLRCMNKEDKDQCIQKVSQANTNKFLEDMTIWGYNAGIGGIEALFKSFLRYNGLNKTKTISYADLESRFKKWIQSTTQYESFKAKSVKDAKAMKNREKMSPDEFKRWAKASYYDTSNISAYLTKLSKLKKNGDYRNKIGSVRRGEIAGYLGKVKDEAGNVENSLNRSVDKGYIQCTN